MSGLLHEIYGAMHAGHLRLAAGGVRSLIDGVMTEVVGDQATFGRLIEVFTDEGHLSPKGRDRINEVIEAGHAAIYRGLQPKKSDIEIMLDTTEQMLRSGYVHDEAGQQLKSITPPQPQWRRASHTAARRPPLAHANNSKARSRRPAIDSSHVAGICSSGCFVSAALRAGRTARFA